MPPASSQSSRSRHRRHEHRSPAIPATAQPPDKVASTNNEGRLTNNILIESGGQEAPIKRRRIALACGTCRSRKSKCDGSRPKCSMCQELGSDCVYQQVRDFPNLTLGKEYVAQLEHRVSQIEDFIRSLREGRTEISAKPVFTPFHEEADSYGRHGNSASSTEHQSSHMRLVSSVVNSSENETRALDNSEDAIDGMAAVQFQNEHDPGFFGPSSNIAFMQHISQAISHASHSSTSLSSVPIKTRHDNRRKSQSPSHEFTRRVLDDTPVKSYELPSDEQSWDLLDIYFSKTGQLLPFIHEPSFRETYLQVKSNNFNNVRRTWLGLLNIIFAIAMSLSNDGDIPAQQRIERSDIFFQRANALCDQDSRRKTSLEMVQYLLILGQYLQGTQKSAQALSNHGLAITAAFRLGIHSPESNKGFSPLECEIRKRTWFGCVLLDRTLSMTFGRPCVIPQSYIRLEMPLLGVQMMGQFAQPAIHAHLDGCFFTAAIQLYFVMYNVIDTCYGQNLGFASCDTPQGLRSAIYECNRQLNQWQYELVPSLGLHILQSPLTATDIDIMKSENVVTARFNIVLSMRFHNLRILLHRQSLERFLNKENQNYWHSTNAESGGKLQLQVEIDNISNCVESAIIIISTVHTIVTADGWRRNLLGAWNYSLYYTFNAGLVILSSLLVSATENAKNPAAWEFAERSRPYLDLALDALRHLDSGNSVIERCIEYFSQILALTALNSDPGPRLPQQQQQELLNNRGNRFSDNIDLGEFMIDSDLDILGGLFFDINQQGEGIDPSISG